MQDLFPGVEIPDHDYGRLQEEIEHVSLARGLQVVATQVKKVIQLYETLLVRHGVMLVGPTGGGKTTIYRVRRSSSRMQTPLLLFVIFVSFMQFHSI